MPAAGDVVARFHEEHQLRYGYHHAGREIELVTLRLRATLRTPQPKVARQPVPRRPEARVASRVSPVERVPAFIHEKTAMTPVFERKDLVPCQVIIGPALITEYSATTVIPEGKEFWVDASENLVIETRPATSAKI